MFISSICIITAFLVGELWYNSVSYSFFAFVSKTMKTKILGIQKEHLKNTMNTIAWVKGHFTSNTFHQEIEIFLERETSKEIGKN